MHGTSYSPITLHAHPLLGKVRAKSSRLVLRTSRARVQDCAFAEVEDAECNAAQLIEDNGDEQDSSLKIVQLSKARRNSVHYQFHHCREWMQHSELQLCAPREVAPVVLNSELSVVHLFLFTSILHGILK